MSGIEISNYDDITSPVTEPSWDHKTVHDEFEFIAFSAPYVEVRRKSDGVVGILEFKHHPRVYYGFQAAP